MEPESMKESTPKTPAIPLLIAVLAFSIVTIFSRVLIHQEIARILSYVSFIASTLLIFIGGRAVMDKSSNLHKNWTKSGAKPISLIIGLILIIPLMIYPSIAIGIPSALHMLLSHPGQMIVTVKSKAKHYTNRRGNGGVYLIGYTHFMNDELYGINKSDWDSLKPGDRLLISGKSSYFGFSYSQYEKL